MTIERLENRSAAASLAFKKKQALLTRVAYAIAILVTLKTTLLYILMPGFTPAKVFAAFACVSLFAIGRFSQFKSLYDYCAIGIVCVIMLGGIGGSLTNGGIDGYLAPILITAPIAASLFLGARSTLISAASVVAAFACLYVLKDSSFIRPSAYGEGALEVGTLILLITATSICSAGTWYFAKESQSQIDTLTKAQAKLRRAAHYDALTGIPNRAMLNKTIEDLKNQNNGGSSRICAIQVDLDHFKEINDTHGHLIGDRVIQHAAKVLQNACRSSDTVARMGGDEFIILYLLDDHETEVHVQKFCDRLVETLCKPILIDEITCQIGASIGYAISNESQCLERSLIHCADVALYDVKENGRGFARRFTPDMQRRASDQKSLVSDVDGALRENRTSCYFQPIICVDTGSVTGFEALGRIRSVSGKLLAPGDFLPVLEERKMLAEFDMRVAGHALDGLQEIRESGFDVAHVSINASACSLRSENYLKHLEKELGSRNLSPSDLVVEIVETVFVDGEHDPAKQMIEDLHQAGIKCVMDDFGSGYSSMASLLGLPLDGLKIDRSIVANLPNERAKQAVEALFALSKSMDIPTVVEGIETSEQYKTIQELGGSRAQGYKICRPKGLSDLITWLGDYGRSPASRLQEQLAS